MRGVAAGRDAGLVVAAADEAFDRDFTCGEPGRGVEGDAELRKGSGGEFADEAGRIEVGELETGRVEAGAESGRKPAEVAFDPEAVGRPVGHEVDAR